jgi:cation transport ATPase
MGLPKSTLSGTKSVAAARRAAVAAKQKDRKKADLRQKHHQQRHQQQQRQEHHSTKTNKQQMWLLLMLLLLSVPAAAQQAMPFQGTGDAPPAIPTDVCVSAFVDRLIEVNDRDYSFQVCCCYHNYCDTITM